MNTSEDYLIPDLDIIPLLDKIVIWSLLFLGALSLITNSLNMAVYAMIGFQDSIFVCFFAMSICDLCYIIMTSISNSYNFISLMDPRLLYYVNIQIYKIKFYGDMVFDISVCVKTFIAVQRGCCVAFPFHVSRVFTRKRDAVVILCLGLLSLACYVNDEFLTEKGIFTNEFDNETYFYSVTSEGMMIADIIRRTFNKTFLICFCDILILLSLIIIIYGMSSTPKWRQSISSEKVNNLFKSKTWIKIICLFNRNKKVVLSEDYNCNINGNVQKQPKRLKNSKELKVVKQVVLISALHLICYTPVAVWAITHEIMTNSYFSYKLQNLYLIISSLLQLIGPLNVTINFFIYRTYNYKFKRTLLTMCKRIHEDGN